MRRLPNTYPGDTTKYPNGRGTIGIGAADAGSKVLFYNETPVNLDLDFYNGDTDVLHAWEANFWILDGEVSDITWAIDVDSLTVTNPPINAIFATIFNPHEQLNSKAYPMPLIRQIGGQQAIVSSASTVTNEGNAANTLIVDIGDAAFPQLFTLYTDGHALWSVDQAGVKHQVMKVQAAGTPLQVGQAGDIVEVFGEVHATTAGLNINTQFDSGNATNRIVLQALPGFELTIADSSDHWLFNTQGGAALFTAGGGGSMHFQIPFGTDLMTISSTLNHVLQALQVDGACTLAAAGLVTHILGTLTVDQAATFTVDPQLTSKKIADNAGNNLIDFSAAGVFVKGNPTTGGAFTYQRVSGTTDWSLSTIGPAVTGSASATVNHLTKVAGVSTAPTDFLMNPSTAGGSQTFGFNTITSTQVNVVLGASNAYRFRGII